MGQEKNVEDLSFNKAVLHVSAGTASYTLTRLQRTCIVAATDNTGHITVILPPPDQCLGLIFSVSLVTKATSNVLVHDIAHQTHLLATLDTSGDDVLVYCDGFEYRPIGGTYT